MSFQSGLNNGIFICLLPCSLQLNIADQISICKIIVLSDEKS